MNVKILPILISILTVGTAFAEIADDQILASFDREFNHQQVPQRPIARTSVSEDPLYELINASLWIDFAQTNPVISKILSARTVTLLEKCAESKQENMKDTCYAAAMSIRVDFRMNHQKIAAPAG